MTNIPKIIHFIWLGDTPKDGVVLKCIDSWRENLPDYEIVEWTEKELDIDELGTYVKEAYDAEKWAFAADYIRAYVLYNNGGIYLDSDVEIKRPLDDLLDHEMFCGFENEKNVSTSIMAGVKGHQVFKDILDYYAGRSFMRDDGSFDIPEDVNVLTKIAVEKYGLQQNGELQVLENGIHVYPPDWFCPIDPEDLSKNMTENTYSVHHMRQSWRSPLERFKKNANIRIDKFRGLFRKSK